jgi:hypothetical protein
MNSPIKCRLLADLTIYMLRCSNAIEGGYQLPFKEKRCRMVGFTRPQTALAKLR